MSLPGVIAIDPLERLPVADVVVPGSKSITNRAMIRAVLRDGTTTLRGALWSDDTRVMVACLRDLGYQIEILADPTESSNRTLVVTGQGGRVPAGGTDVAPRELFVGNAGTAARFLLAFLCLGKGVYRLSGVARMHERPQAGLVSALKQLGYRIEAPGGRLPALIYGGGVKGGECEVDIAESSQFASALLLAAEEGGWKVGFRGEGGASSPYVRMTTELIQAMRSAGDDFQIEPDASSGSYFWGLNGLGLPPLATSDEEQRNSERSSVVRVQNWPESGWQIDAEFPRFLSVAGELSRERDLGDSIMTAVVLAAVGNGPSRFTDLGRLRVQECERVEALRTELERCGVEVVEEGDMLIVTRGALRPAVIQTYDDHRMAMCFTLLGLKAAGIQISDPSCVKKTFPNFFQKLALPPPFGVGAILRDGESGQRLADADLVAE